jgi:outer membrane lipoprotein SlyB
MEVVTKRQIRSTRISSLVVATVASGMIAGLVLLGTVSGLLPNRGSAARSEEPSRVAPQTTGVGACALCGTIESVRVIEVYEEPSGAAGTIDPRSGETAGGGPGGAIASAATSVLDTLSSAVRGSDAEKNLRKRYVYRVTLRMDDGSFRAISLPGPPAFAVGDKVRVVDGRLVRA